MLFRSEAFAAFAGKVLGEKIDWNDAAQLQQAVQNKKVEKAVINELDKIGKKNKFNSYEKVKAVRLFVDPFTVDNELLTPT